MKFESCFVRTKRSWRQMAVTTGAFTPALVVTAFVATSCAETVETTVFLGGSADSGTPIFGSPSDAASDGQVVVEEPEMCIATECPYPYATCPLPIGIPYKCQTNLASDDRNCGACGNVCPYNLPEKHMYATCVDGECNPGCVLSFQDCNGLLDDGCEVSTFEDPDNCGACGKVCPELVKGVRGCTGGECNTECLPPLSWCADQLLCTDTATDDFNCGACGNECPFMPTLPPPQMRHACVEGECGHLVCETYWADCNDDIDSDGCEIDILTDLNNCGGCGNRCAPGETCLLKDNTPTCVCESCCKANETFCVEGDDRYCTDLLSDVNNCGVCGHHCIGRKIPLCHNGFCEDECGPGWGDCDGNIHNGCETDLMINTLHCGACGNQCDIDLGQPCVEGKCLMVECDAGPVQR